VRAAEEMLEQHAAAARLEMQRREQRDIDEAAERRGDG
jgi:flagellar biosynthesis chaperone FliJ